MFVLEKNPTYTRAVTIKVPIAEGDGIERKKLKVTFSVMPSTEFNALLDAALSKPTRSEGMTDEQYGAALMDADRKARNFYLDHMREVVVGWPDDSGIVDQGGRPVPYSPEAKEVLLNIPYVLDGIKAHYDAMIAGTAPAK